MANVSQITLRPDKNGNDYKSVVLDEPVKGKTRFNIFPRHTRYNDVTQGRAFSADEFTLNGEYLEMVDPNKGVKTGLGGRKTFDASVVMERKNENIRESQERKNDSIKISSTARDASMILVALMSRGDVGAQDWQSKWVEIRKWLLEHFDDVESIEPIF